MNNYGVATRNWVSNIECSLSVAAGWCWSFSRRAVFLHCPVRWKTRKEKDKEGQDKKTGILWLFRLVVYLIVRPVLKETKELEGISVLRFQCWSELTTSTTQYISVLVSLLPGQLLSFCPYRPKAIILSVKAFKQNIRNRTYLCLGLRLARFLGHYWEYFTVSPEFYWSPIATNLLV